MNDLQALRKTRRVHFDRDLQACQGDPLKFLALMASQRSWYDALIAQRKSERKIQKVTA